MKYTRGQRVCIYDVLRGDEYYAAFCEKRFSPYGTVKSSSNDTTLDVVIDWYAESNGKFVKNVECFFIRAKAISITPKEEEMLVSGEWIVNDIGEICINHEYKHPVPIPELSSSEIQDFKQLISDL